MKIVILTIAGDRRQPPVEAIWGPLHQHATVTIERLTKEQAKKLPAHLPLEDLARADHVLLDLPFRYIRRHGGGLAKLPNLCIFEQDSYQEFIRGHRFRGAYSRFYRTCRPRLIISNGYRHACQFRQLGLPVRYVSKGYAADQIYECPRERNIPIAFIGRYQTGTYQGRRALLEGLQEHFPLQLLRTNSIAEYRETLSRIGIFVSADIGFDEPTAKNFEAMACGCLLLAKRNGLDDWRLGFRDMHNMVAYDDLLEACEKLHFLQREPERIAAIAKAGKVLVNQRHTLQNKAAEIVALLGDETPPSCCPQA